MEPREVPLAAVSGSLLLGGTSTFLLNLARGLGPENPLPVVVLSEHHEMARDFDALHIPVELISRRAHIYEDRLRLAYAALARWRPAAVIASLAAESFEVLRLVPPGVRRIGMIQSHDPGPHTVVRRYAPWLDVVVGVSETICEVARRAPELARTRVDYIPYGIAFPPLPHRVFTSPAEPLRLLYLGRMTEEQKRIRRVAALIEQLAARGLTFEFTFVGSGAQREELEGQLRHHANVRFAGGVPNAQVKQFLQGSDLLVLLSDYEGLPLSLLEAMGAGVVPIVSDLESGIREVVTEHTGFRVPVGDVAAAADAVMRLAQDRELLARQSNAAAQFVRDQFSAGRMAQGFRALVSGNEARPVWPAQVRVPAPLGVQPAWLYRGAGRVLRRWTKKLSGAARAPSSRS